GVALIQTREDHLQALLDAVAHPQKGGIAGLAFGEDRIPGLELDGLHRTDLFGSRRVPAQFTYLGASIMSVTAWQWLVAQCARCGVARAMTQAGGGALAIWRLVRTP